MRVASRRPLGPAATSDIRTAFKTFKPALAGQSGRMGLAIVLSLAVTGLELLRPWPVTWVIDRLVAADVGAGDASSVALAPIAVFAALADKDVAGMLRPLIDHVAHWHLAGLVADGVRGRSAEELMQESGDLLQGRPVSLHRDVAAAVSSVHAAAGTGDLVLVFGSFYTVAAALQTLEGTSD